MMSITSRIDAIGKLINYKRNTETSSVSQWRATPERVTISRWITKGLGSQIMSFGVSSSSTIQCGFLIWAGVFMYRDTCFFVADNN